MSDLKIPKLDFKKINEIAVKYLNLEAEIKTNLQILRDYEFHIDKLMEAVESYTIQDASAGVIIKKIVKESQFFNSKKFKSRYPKQYEECRMPSKTFKQDALMEKYPDLYKEFLENIRNKSISIERYTEPYTKVLKDIE